MEKILLNIRVLRDNYIYEGDDLGVQCTPEGTVFRLWSPRPEGSLLICIGKEAEDDPFQSVSMKKENKGVWGWKCREELHGVYYDYMLEIDGKNVRSADPYAKACGMNGERSMA